jgi:hypothetical protein
MIECQYASRLGAYHDGELDSPAAAEMERHVGGCASCQAELSRLRGLSRLMGGWQPPQPSPCAMRRFHATAALAGSGAIRHWAEALTAVAAAILITFTFWLWRMPPVGSAAEPASRGEVSVIQHASELPSSASEDEFSAWLIQDAPSEGSHDQN